MENESFLVVDVWDQRQSKQKFIQQLVTEKFENIYIFTQNEWEYSVTFDEFVPPLLGYFLEHSGTNIDVIVSLARKLDTPEYKGYNVHLWDTYWLYKTYSLLKTQGLINQRKEQRENHSQLKYHFIMMNNRAHDFRCKLIDTVAERDLLKYAAVSWNNVDPFLMQNYKFQHFHGKEMVLDDDYKTTGGQYSLPDQYYESFAQLVSESTPDYLFFSEKISTALIAGKPFIAAAAPGMHRYLKDELGFKLYDEIFDYTFDDELDMSKRWSMIADNFRRLCNYSLIDLAELRSRIHNKVEFNQYRAKEIVFDLNFMPNPIKKCLEMYKNKHIINLGLTRIFENMDDAKQLGPEWDLI